MPPRAGNTPRELGQHRVWTEYRSRAHRDQLEWTLTSDEFFQLVMMPCHYCGAAPGRVMYQAAYQDEDELFICGGIDRKDSRQGYTQTNVVPACTLCNWRKGDLDYDSFLLWVERVYRHLQSKNTHAGF